MPDRAPGPEITVVVVAYRPRPFLRIALESLARQDLDPRRFEVVVVRDLSSSPDETTVSDLRVRSVRLHAPEKGRMMVAGAEAARAPIVAWMDDDDLFQPNKLSTALAWFASDPDLIYFHHYRTRIDVDGRTIPTSPPAYPRTRLPPDEPRALRRLAGVDFLTDSCTVTTRGLATGLGAFLPTIEIGTDFAMLFGALASRGALRFDPAPLTSYRRHADQASRVVDSGTYDRTVADVRRIVAYCRQSSSGPILRSSRGLLELLRVEESSRQSPLDRTEIARRLIALIPLAGTFVVRSNLDVVRRATLRLASGKATPAPSAT